MKYYNIPFRSIKHKIRTSKRGRLMLRLGISPLTSLHMFIKIYLCVYCMISELKAAFSLSFWFHSRLDCVIRSISAMCMQSVLMPQVQTATFLSFLACIQSRRTTTSTLTLQAGSVSFINAIGPLVPVADVLAFCSKAPVGF